MTTARLTPDRCRKCKSTDLFSAFFNDEGDAESDDSNGAQWQTICNDCSSWVR